MRRFPLDNLVRVVYVAHMSANKFIRVDEDVHRRLGELRKGFETVNAVLRRVLGLDEQEEDDGSTGR